jgi:hypothetical protein
MDDSVAIRNLIVSLGSAWNGVINSFRGPRRLSSPVTEHGELTCLNGQFGVLSSVASFDGVIAARALPKLERRWHRTLCDRFAILGECTSNLFVQLTLERHDFDKRSVGGMTEKAELEVTVSTLDRVHDESEDRLPIPARYSVDSEGVTNADIAFGIAFASAKRVPGVKEQVKRVNL